METDKGVPTAWSSELRRNLGPKAAHLLVPSAGAGRGSPQGWSLLDSRLRSASPGLGLSAFRTRSLPLGLTPSPAPLLLLRPLREPVESIH